MGSHPLPRPGMGSPLPSAGGSARYDLIDARTGSSCATPSAAKTAMPRKRKSASQCVVLPVRLVALTQAASSEWDGPVAQRAKKTARAPTSATTPTTDTGPREAMRTGRQSGKTTSVTTPTAAACGTPGKMDCTFEARNRV